MSPKEKCLKVWRRLEETGGASKRNAYGELGLKPDLNYCAACESTPYVENGYKVPKLVCTECPMYGKWWGPTIKPVNLCGISGTYYRLWVAVADDDKKAKSFFAGKVADNVEAEWKDD